MNGPLRARQTLSDEDSSDSPLEQHPEEEEPVVKTLKYTRSFQAKLLHNVYLASSDSSFGEASGEHVVRLTPCTDVLRGRFRRHGILLWLLGFAFFLLSPLYMFLFMQPRNTDDPEAQLPFKLLTLALDFSLGASAFVFVVSNVIEHGVAGILLLDAAANEKATVQLLYQICLRQSTSLLACLLLPCLLLHLLHKVWLFAVLPLALVPFRPDASPDSPAPLPLLLLVFLLTSLAWLLSSALFLFTCVIFWKACSLQEFKMREFMELISCCDDPTACFKEYSRIIVGLSLISRRFRAFLAFTLLITLTGALASMFELVRHGGQDLEFYRTGDLLVANLCAMLGSGLCLRSASKVSHLHRRIVQVACTMHAEKTNESIITGRSGSNRRGLLWSTPGFGSATGLLLRTHSGPKPRSSAGYNSSQQQAVRTAASQQPEYGNQPRPQAALWAPVGSPSVCALQPSSPLSQHRRELGCSCAEELAPREMSDHTRKLSEAAAVEELVRLNKNQEAWNQRAALGNFMANSVVGISVYGFVLDRVFVHTSAGALLTTTWFILGQSILAAVRQ